MTKNPSRRTSRSTARAISKARNPCPRYQHGPGKAAFRTSHRTKRFVRGVAHSHGFRSISHEAVFLECYIEFHQVAVLQEPVARVPCTASSVTLIRFVPGKP